MKDGLVVLGLIFAFALPDAAAAQDVAAAQLGQRAFAQCGACHAVIEGQPSGVGPNLHGVFGKRAGTNAKDYSYSPAMKAYGAVWSDATLDTFLANPMKAVPGTKMPYRGIEDAGTRAALIAYLKAKTASVAQ